MSRVAMWPLAFRQNSEHVEYTHTHTTPQPVLREEYNLRQRSEMCRLRLRGAREWLVLSGCSSPCVFHHANTLNVVHVLHVP